MMTNLSRLQISDFGHSGACGNGSLQVRARNAGRCTPCAPELMAHGTLTKVRSALTEAGA